MPLRLRCVDQVGAERRVDTASHEAARSPHRDVGCVRLWWKLVSPCGDALCAPTSGKTIKRPALAAKEVSGSRRLRMSRVKGALGIESEGVGCHSCTPLVEEKQGMTSLDPDTEVRSPLERLGEAGTRPAPR